MQRSRLPAVLAAAATRAHRRPPSRRLRARDAAADRSVSALSNPTCRPSITELPMSAPLLPVVIIGAGPAGLAAAAHVLARRLTPVVFEASPSAGAGIRPSGHVRMFSPWRYNVNAAATAIQERYGWMQ